MLQTSFLQSEMKRGSDCLHSKGNIMTAPKIEMGDHVRVPSMAGQSGFVVAKNTMKGIKGVDILHCYHRGKCIDIVFDEGLIVMKKQDVERLIGEPINVDELKQELIDKGEL